MNLPPTVTECRMLLQGTRFEVVPSAIVRLLPDALLVLEEFVAHTKRSGGFINPYLRELVAEAEGILEGIETSSEEWIVQQGAEPRKVQNVRWKDILAQGWMRLSVGEWEDATGRKWQETRLDHNFTEFVEITVVGGSFQETERRTRELASLVMGTNTGAVCHCAEPCRSADCTGDHHVSPSTHIETSGGAE